MKYVVHITELLGRDVIVDAEDRAEAEEIVEDLCCNGSIELDMDDWGERTVEAVRTPDDEDRENLVEYTRSGAEVEG